MTLSNQTSRCICKCIRIIFNVNYSFIFHHVITYLQGAEPEGGQDPSENHKNIGFLSNTCPDSLKNFASIQCWATIGPPAKHHFNGVLLAGQ